MKSNSNEISPRILSENQTISVEKVTDIINEKVANLTRLPEAGDEGVRLLHALELHDLRTVELLSNSLLRDVSVQSELTSKSPDGSLYQLLTSLLVNRLTHLSDNACTFVKEEQGNAIEEQTSFLFEWKVTSTEFYYYLNKAAVHVAFSSLFPTPQDKSQYSLVTDEAFSFPTLDKLMSSWITDKQFSDLTIAAAEVLIEVKSEAALLPDFPSNGADTTGRAVIDSGPLPWMFEQSSKAYRLDNVDFALTLYLEALFEYLNEQRESEELSDDAADALEKEYRDHLLDIVKDLTKDGEPEQLSISGQILRVLRQATKPRATFRNPFEEANVIELSSNAIEIKRVILERFQVLSDS